MDFIMSSKFTKKQEINLKKKIKKTYIYEKYK